MKSMVESDSYSLLLKYAELGLISTELATVLWNQTKGSQLSFLAFQPSLFQFHSLSCNPENDLPAHRATSELARR